MHSGLDRLFNPNDNSISMSDKNNFVSNIKDIPYSQDIVFSKLQDLRHLESLKNQLDNPAFLTQLEEKFGKDKIDEAAKKLQSVQFTQDTISLDSPMGALKLAIIEREEPKCIKFEAQGAPIALNLWIQLLPTANDHTAMRVTLRAELNMFIRHMVEGKLKTGVEQLAELLAHIPYGAIQS